MIPVEKAREIILSHVESLPPEKISVSSALGRYIAENILSDKDIPPWDNSAMDGYAVRHDDCVSTNNRLRVIYDLPAGSVPEVVVKKGEAVKIMTGAPVPYGVDTVVKREDTIEKPNTVVIKRSPKKGENIRHKGEDIKNGEKILKKGDYIGPAQIGILASLKKSNIYCAQRPMVAILATGDEVIDIDEDLTQGKIVSSNSYTLISLVKMAGGIPIYLGISKDTKKDLETKLSAARRADLILTSGGVSMGDYDIIKEVMESHENTMKFWQVEMKPGKPLAFGRIHGLPAIGLPGNPVSSMISFYQFARPAILKMMGANNLLLPRVRAKITTSVSKKPGRRHYLRGILSTDNGDLIVDTTGPQGSGILSSMGKANCFIVIPKEKSHICQDEMVDCEVIRASW